MKAYSMTYLQAATEYAHIVAIRVKAPTTTTATWSRAATSARKAAVGPRISKYVISMQHQSGPTMH